MYGHDCPHCVDLSTVHQPLRASSALVYQACFYCVAIILSFIIYLPLQTGGLAAVIFAVGLLVSILLYDVVYFVSHCSRFRLALDHDGHIHVHRTSQRFDDARIILTVKAGLWPRRCRVFDYLCIPWTVTANHDFMYFKDMEGTVLSVKYCTKIPATATEHSYYSSLVTCHLPTVLRLVTRVQFVSQISERALTLILQDKNEPTSIAGSINKNAS